MSYIKEDEIPLYCSIPNVTMLTIENAGSLIEAYAGGTFKEVIHEEKVVFYKKPKRRHLDLNYRGKLLHKPRREILSITTIGSSPWGTRETTDFPVNSLVFDSPKSPYFTFYPPEMNFLTGQITNVIPFIYVRYSSGYGENEYPEALKRAVGMLASNLTQAGGTLEWVARDDYDIKVKLSDKGIFTDEIKRLVDMVVM